jgi:hypothetical protein
MRWKLIADGFGLEADWSSKMTHRNIVGSKYQPFPEEMFEVFTEHVTQVLKKSLEHDAARLLRMVLEAHDCGFVLDGELVKEIRIFLSDPSPARKNTE